MLDSAGPAKVYPIAQFVGVEPDEVTNPNERYLFVGYEAANLSHRDAKRLSHGLDVDQAR